MKAVIAGLIASLLLVFLYLLIIFLPTTDTVEHLTTEHRSLLKGRDERQQVADNLDTYREKEIQLRKEIARSKLELPDEWGAENRIDALAIRVGIGKITITTSDVQSMDYYGFYETQRILLRFGGSPSAVGKFLDQLDGEAWILSFQSVEIRGTKKRVTVQADARLYRFNPSSP